MSLFFNFTTFLERLPKSQPTQPINESVSLTLAQQPDFGIEKIREISKLIASKRNIGGIRIGFYDNGKAAYSPGVLVDITGYDYQVLTSALRIISQKLFPSLSNMNSIYDNLNTQFFCHIRDGMTHEEAVREIFTNMKIGNLKVISGKAIVDLAQSLECKEIDPQQRERIQKLLFGNLDGD